MWSLYIQMCWWLSQGVCSAPSVWLQPSLLVPRRTSPMEHCRDLKLTGQVFLCRGNNRAWSCLHGSLGGLTKQVEHARWNKQATQATQRKPGTHCGQVKS